MSKGKVRILIVFLLAFAVVTVPMGSPLVEAQSQAASTVALPSDFVEKLAKIEKEIEEKRKEFGVPGVAVAIVKDDRVIFQKGFGLRDVEHNLPVTAETIFAIGSVTKSFTAMAAVISQDAGKLSLDDSPKKYLPYFRLQDPEADAMITVRDLLDHSSGLALNDIVTSSGVLNRTDVIKVAGRAKPTARLREKFQYSNVMYSAAGEVVANANGTSWEKFVEERIFKPLGMKSSSPSPTQMTKTTNHAMGYGLDNKVAMKALSDRDVTSIAPAGAISSNVVDMSQWIRLMLGNGVLSGKRLVSEKGFNQLVKKYIAVDENFVQFYRQNTGYGLGWFLTERNGHHLISHPGGINGFTSLVEMVPDQKFGFVILANGSGNTPVRIIRDAIFDNIVGELQTIAVNMEPALPKSEPARREATVGAGAPPSIDITVDELMAKAIAAAGGEANLRRHYSTTGSATLDFENQGLTGKIDTYAQAPNSSMQITTILGLGKKIRYQREYFDGTRGGVENSPGESEEYKDEQLESTRISSDYYDLLDWKTLYNTVAIKEKSKVGGEEAYVVVKTPEKGDAITDYISAKSFLVLKRERAGQETVFTDYCNIDGEMVSLTAVVQDEELGRIVFKMRKVRFNVRIPASMFRQP